MASRIESLSQPTDTIVRFDETSDLLVRQGIVPVRTAQLIWIRFPVGQTRPTGGTRRKKCEIGYVVEAVKIDGANPRCALKCARPMCAPK